MREQREHFLTTLQRSGPTADERIDQALGRAYALLIRLADKAHADEQQGQEQHEGQEG
jgi:hypothetical protein